MSLYRNTDRKGRANETQLFFVIPLILLNEKEGERETFRSIETILVNSAIQQKAAVTLVNSAPSIRLKSFLYIIFLFFL
jgi:hypothetical protein